MMPASDTKKEQGSSEGWGKAQRKPYVCAEQTHYIAQRSSAVITNTDKLPAEHAPSFDRDVDDVVS